MLLIVQSQDIQYAIAPLWYCVYRIRAVTLFSLYATCITSLFCAGCLCRNKDDILQEHLRVHNQSPGNQQQQTHDQCSGAILTRLQLVKIPAPAPAPALLFAKQFLLFKKNLWKISLPSFPGLVLFTERYESYALLFTWRDILIYYPDCKKKNYFL